MEAKPCGYEKHAERLAVEARLVPGTGGIFEVRIGEETVAKRSKGHFPDPAEVVAAVAAARK